ncbi:MAG: hypothetical protein JWO59_3600 [Chloroflexi bacterium]|nr:hypothetical protein [Chloroflexota bacterium]
MFDNTAPSTCKHAADLVWRDQPDGGYWVLVYASCDATEITPCPQPKCGHEFCSEHIGIHASLHEMARAAA